MTTISQRAETTSRTWPELPGVTHRFVQTSRLRFHVAEAGPADGEPVLLLHGWLQHSYAWRDVIPALSPHFRLICPDLRGCGWTEAPPTGYHTRDLAADILGLLDTMALDRVHVVGHDRGAGLGFELAMQQPERIRRLVAVNGMHPWPVRRLVAPDAWRFWWTPAVETPFVGRFVIGRIPGAARWLLRRGPAARRQRTGDGTRVFLDRVREPARARAAEQMMYQFAYHEMLPTIRGANRSRRLTVPTLMLNGARDRQQSVRSLGGHEPYTDRLSVRLVAGAGHALPEERPAEVAAACNAFLGADEDPADIVP
jgi:pimeloyl-ACP methyl ester carboxylesterase